MGNDHRMHATATDNRRRWLVCLLIGVLFIVAVALMYQHLNRPFKTASQFHRYLQNEQFEDAKAMIDVGDQQRIPDRYWQQFRGHPPDFLMSPNLPALIYGRMAIKPTIMNHDGLFIEIRYEIHGCRIRIAEMTEVTISPTTPSTNPATSPERKSP